MKQRFFATAFTIFLTVFFSACTPPPPPDPCENLTGTTICMNGTIYETNDNYWNGVPGDHSIIFQQVPTGSPPPPFPYFTGAFGFNDSNQPAIPATGTYVGEWSDSVGMDFYCYVGLNNGGSETYLMMDTTETNMLNITESDGIVLSGNIDCWLYNYDLPSDKRRLRISFEDIPHQ